ncbi:MAG TPA: hypothetical protein VK671_02575 [Mucilaginibacter sp.]|nr:hypothetical protein [Mucilaginibacter sp.]
MGGPWIGDISIGDDFISKDCVVDNFVYKEDMSLLFFVKYHIISKRYWYFSINFFNIDTKVNYEFTNEFDMVHIGSFISKDELEIFHAFHDKNEHRRRVFKLDEEDFHLVA